MYAECRHVFTSGRKCTHPMLKNSTFCYFHRNLHEQMHAPAPRPGTPFRLPLLEDAHGCRMAIQQVCWNMGDKRVTQKEAGTYLYGISLAMRLIPRRPAATRTPVRTLCYDNDGFEMAEAVDTCEPPQDCLTCKKHCHWYEYYEDEVEEIEEQMAEEEEEKRLAAIRAENPNSEELPENAKPDLSKPWKGKYDHEPPNIRALLEKIESDAYEEYKLRQEQQIRLKAKKDAESVTPPAPQTSGAPS